MQGAMPNRVSAWPEVANPTRPSNATACGLARTSIRAAPRSPAIRAGVVAERPAYAAAHPTRLDKQRVELARARLRRKQRGEPDNGAVLLRDANRAGTCRVPSRPRASATRDDVRPGVGATGRTRSALSGPQFTRGVEVDPSFFVDFHDARTAPRAHEPRLQGGDGTGEIFL